MRARRGTFLGDPARFFLCPIIGAQIHKKATVTEKNPMIPIAVDVDSAL